MKKAAKQHTNHYRATLQKSGVEEVSVRAAELFLPSGGGGGYPRNHSSGVRSSTSSAANHIPKTLPASPQ